MKDLETIWNQKTSEERKDWIWGAGFTRDTANRYSIMTWINLPHYIRETLIQQES